MPDLKDSLDQAVGDGQLLDSSADNILGLLGSSTNPLYRQAIQELVDAGAWEELNDRFYKKLAFGTGGLRGRTIGKVITRAEAGEGGPNERPEFPCVGTASMNFYNLSRAARGLAKYLRDWLKSDGIDAKPKIVFCHDTRHFSRDFAEFCARVCAENGCDVYLFDSHRATPVLSFAIRALNCHAGCMITASHNPAHDNGLKVNFSDGAAIVPPHTDGIIAEVNSLASEDYDPLPPAEQGSVTIVGPELDRLYIERLQGLILQPELLKQTQGLKIVFTALHGAGGVMIPGLLRDMGFDCITVPEQDAPDGRFPTVKSPNPENAPALQLGVDLAEKVGAAIVMGTDPDCDRMGIFARGGDGEMHLLTGNQIGSLMAYYRLKTMFDLGILNEGNKDRAILIKTFVTTELQRAIAEKYGVTCINTLTGFKYIGQKLAKYERALGDEILKNYRDLSEPETRALRLEHSKFFVFGGEESYGYLACDFTRDKDANAAAMMFAETVAYAESRGITIVDLMDEIYVEFGYYTEYNANRTFEGAEGATKIAALATSYADSPPAECDGVKVTKIRNFGTEDITDEEGDPIPKEKMLFVDLEDGRTFAVRPSGTEPKIKYYLFGRNDVPEASQLAEIKSATTSGLESLWGWLSTDIDARLG